MRRASIVNFIIAAAVGLALICLSLPPMVRAKAETPVYESLSLAEPSTQSTNWKITGITVQEYDQGSGTLGEDLGFSETYTSSANIPYGPILVVVEVTGELEPGHGKSIALTATQGRKAIFSGTYGPGAYQGQSEDGKKFYAPFWIPSNVLCDPIRLSARVVGQRPSSTLANTVKFECGE